jgi:hypothetical protein
MQVQPQRLLRFQQRRQISLRHFGRSDLRCRRTDIDRCNCLAAAIFNGSGKETEANLQLLIDDGIAICANATKLRSWSTPRLPLHAIRSRPGGSISLGPLQSELILWKIAA